MLFFFLMGKVSDQRYEVTPKATRKSMSAMVRLEPMFPASQTFPLYHTFCLLGTQPMRTSSQAPELSSCGKRAQLLHSVWDLPGPEIEPMSPALAGRFFTSGPPGKPSLPTESVLNPFSTQVNFWDLYILTEGRRGRKGDGR